MPEQTGTIHDIGYRGYDGAREGTRALVLTLFTTGLRHAFGLGRSGRSKVLPFILLGLGVLPAAIVVGVVTMLPFDSLPVSYADYLNQIQVLVTLFAAAQAPVLFSRDLRHRSIVLYLARPLPPALFGLTRWASLATAILVFTLLPTLLLYAGGLLAGLDSGEQTPVFLRSVALQLLLAALLAGITGVIASWALRRGFAVVASIVMLIVVTGVVLIVQQIADYEQIATIGEVAGLFSPWSMHNGLAQAWDAGGEATIQLTGAWPLAYLATGLAVVAACLALVAARFVKVGSR